LIYGARKSGTTMLANLHDGGDELLVFPAEVKLNQFVKKWTDRPVAAESFYSRSRLLGTPLPNFDSECYETQVECLKARGIPNLRDLLRHDIYAVHRSVMRKPEKPSSWGLKEVGATPIGSCNSSGIYFPLVGSS
jgi:hypothetical protein